MASLIQKKNTPELFFLLNCLLLILWIILQTIDVYAYAIVGALFEMIWLPMILCFIVTPFVHLFWWHKEKFKVDSKIPYFLILSIVTIWVVLML